MYSAYDSPEFRPIIPMVNCEMGMERQYFAVTPDMVEPLAGIGISVTDHALYLTVTSRGAVRIVPVRQANNDGVQNEYDRTKEIAMLQARGRAVLAPESAAVSTTKFMIPPACGMLV